MSYEQLFRVFLGGGNPVAFVIVSDLLEEKLSEDFIGVCDDLQVVLIIEVSTVKVITAVLFVLVEP